MRRSALWAAGAVCVIVVAAAHLAGQAGPSSGAAPFRQVGYLKASNPGAYDHLGEGNILPGHTGAALAISGDGSTIAVGAPQVAEARGKGYATAAVRLVTENAFHQTPLRKLIAYVHEDNKASVRVLEKAGYTREGLLREHYLVNGRPANEIIYGILRRDALPNGH